jgi:hypothetical protein
MNLTDKEEKVLAQVLDCLEAQFDEDQEAFVEVFDYDEAFVDIQVTFDNEYEQMKVDRSLLSENKTPQEIALTIV